MIKNARTVNVEKPIITFFISVEFIHKTFVKSRCQKFPKCYTLVNSCYTDVKSALNTGILIIFDLMNRSKFQLTILVIALTALVALAGIQFSWIIKAARMQETQFNHSVNMAMNRIIVNLSQNQAICSEVNNCLRGGNGGSCYLLMKSREEWKDIKSVIKNDLNFYGIDLDFEFDIVKIEKEGTAQSSKNTYLSKNLEEILEKSGYKLSLRFPEKSDFLIAQIGDIFIFSIILLLLVFLSSIMIYNFYRKEKLLSDSILDFVNNVTHEFKTPLTNISLANSMMSKNEKVENDDKLSFYSRIIRTEQIKLNEKVEQLLKTNFADLDKPQPDEEIDTASAAENIIETYRVQVEDKGGSMHLKKSGKNFNVSGNLDLFHIAIGNLIDNAIKYSTSAPRIFITLTQSHNQLLIEIEDNGPGISREFRERVFEKYFRVPTGNVHNIDGFGLGLFQVKGIIAKMKGNIRLANKKEGGLKVTVELPLVAKNG